MKKNYELMLVVASNIEEGARNKLVEKFAKMTCDKEIRIEKMGMRKFATPINYRAEGFYTLMHFAATGKEVAEMTKLFNITDGIDRYMFVAKTEKQIAADIERKKKRDAARAERAGLEAAAEAKKEEVVAE